MIADRLIQVYEPKAPLQPKKSRFPFIPSLAGCATACLHPKIISTNPLSNTQTPPPLFYPFPIHAQDFFTFDNGKENSKDSISPLIHHSNYKKYHHSPRRSQMATGPAHLLFLLSYTIIVIGINRRFSPQQEYRHRPFASCILLRIPPLSPIIRTQPQR